MGRHRSCDLLRAVTPQSSGRRKPAVVLVIAVYIFGIYALIRTSFFIPAVVVAENHIGLRRAWHLGRGNFWRIIGIMIVVMLPPAVVMSTITQVIVQLVVGQPAVLNAGASDAEVHAFVEKIIASFIKIGPYFAGLEVLYIILLSGLLAGASAVAYKLVIGADAGTAKAPA